MAVTSSIESRLGPNLGNVIIFLLFGGPLLNLHSLLAALPSAVQILLTLAVLTYLVKKLLAFPRWNDELQHVTKFIKAVAVLIFVILVENFCTWATSATDQHKYQYTPLQDNVEIALLWTFRRFPWLRSAILGWRVDMHWLLYSFLAMCLSVIWDQVPYSGFAMGARFMDTIAWTHTLRTIAFMVTVLPNPQPQCYQRNFPPVPSSVRDFIAVGYSSKRGSGCNDLVISGHGVVYAAVPLAIQTFYPARWRGGGLATTAAWAAVVKLCIQEVVDKTHYSVDMLLAVVCTALVWSWREGMYPAGSAVWAKRKRGGAVSSDPVPKVLIALTVGVLLLVLVGVKGV